MRTNNLQIRNFPLEVNKALKKKAVDLGISFGQHVINTLSAAVDAELKSVTRKKATS